MSKSRMNSILENILSLGLALLLVFMIRSSIVEAFKIPSGSMIPTLLVGDHIFVNKFAYGLKVPFSDLVTDKPIYIVKRDPPKRSDIIVFIFPKDESYYYIKRVIGVPGDTIEIRNKTLFVNGQEMKREPVPIAQADEIFTELGEERYGRSSHDLYQEHLSEEPHLIMLDKNNFLGESFGPITVPEGNLFVMGDNRDYSNDSRFWGFVPMDKVKGKAMVIWLSLWFESWKSLPEFRPARIGNALK